MNPQAPPAIAADAKRPTRGEFFACGAYYNKMRTHLALDKNATDGQRFGRIAIIPILSGLHHQYVRM
jgi:hypothetical protein